MAEAYRLILDPGLAPSQVRPALVWAEGLNLAGAAGSMAPLLEAAIAAARDLGDAYIPPEVRRRVRDMLRHGRYKPTGRGKPASEFLLGAALQGSFPRVNCPVDVNNWISLESGFPGSIFDAARSGRRLLIRYGQPGERYVFNPSGQLIELEDLLVVCRRTESGWEPCGNPVKDAMATKVGPATRDVLAVLYAPTSTPPEQVDVWARRYAHALNAHCGAHEVGYHVVDAGTP